VSSHGRGADLVGPHKCSVTSAQKELRIDQRAQKRVARDTVETPQSLRLRCCEAQPGHLDELSLNASEYIIERMLLG
jgi:hypothetical protein